ncbi:hypothetical protein [Cupriavidus sp. BIS7]|uniref:hypothetical protein n=1 Tax=Cupriavidus sp. BIS7 TaxID=1217718 RepID=UPI0012F65DFF|nr:hypothetical protein [Cupriavidus sp. BIS7]
MTPSSSLKFLLINIKMNKSICVIVAALLAVFASASAFADQAIVVFKRSGCDYFIASNNKGLYLLEWYGGYDPSEGDLVVGPINRYGFKDVYYPRQDREGRLYIDDYELSQDSAIDKWKGHCQ